MSIKLFVLSLHRKFKLIHFMISQNSMFAKVSLQIEKQLSSAMQAPCIVENETESSVPCISVIYSDAKPQQEVRRMLESKFPDVEFVTIRREYSLKAYAQAVLEMSQNTIYVVDENGNIVPLSLRAYLLSYLQKAEITKDIDEAIKNNATL